MREQAPRTGLPGPAFDALDADRPEGTTRPPDEVPDVAEAVGARALGLRRLAEQLHDAGGTVGPELAGALRAHAGDVDALAEHLRDAGGAEPDPGERAGEEP